MWQQNEGGASLSDGRWVYQWPPPLWPFFGLSGSLGVETDASKMVMVEQLSPGIRNLWVMSWRWHHPQVSLFTVHDSEWLPEVRKQCRWRCVFVGGWGLGWGSVLKYICRYTIFCFALILWRMPVCCSTVSVFHWTSIINFTLHHKSKCTVWNYICVLVGDFFSLEYQLYVVVLLWKIQALRCRS